VGILLRNTPFPLVEGHSLPIQLGWSYLLLYYHHPRPALLEHPILSPWFNINLCKSGAPQPFEATCNTAPHILYFTNFTCSIYIFPTLSAIFVPDFFL
jgi:hypothetical protein